MIAVVVNFGIEVGRKLKTLLLVVFEKITICWEGGPFRPCLTGVLTPKIERVKLDLGWREAIARTFYKGERRCLWIKNSLSIYPSGILGSR